MNTFKIYFLIFIFKIDYNIFSSNFSIFVYYRDFHGLVKRENWIPVITKLVNNIDTIFHKIEDAAVNFYGELKQC